MKPSNAKVESTGSASTDASVTDQLKAIDTSVLDRLFEMRQDEVRIEEYRQRADKMKDGVDPLVWQRVVADYQSRLSALDAQARPLKTQARREYAKLRALLDRIEVEQKAAQAAKAELDFRHAVGELDAAELASRLAGPVGLLARCDEELAEVGALRTRFVEAFGDEIELAEPASPPGSPAAAVVAPSAGPKPPGGSRVDVPMGEPSDATTFVTVDQLPADAPGSSINTTQPLPSSAGTTAPDPAATMLHTAAPSDAGAADDHTFLLPAAALIVGPDDPSPQEYRLAAVNYLGRADDSHLQIARPGVSRRHAVIMAGNGGFVIQDLGSQNGVFVNGERVSEHALKDGEQVVIGDRTMVFRTPWPPKKGRGDSRAASGKA